MSQLYSILLATQWRHSSYTVPKDINFPRYNMKCSGENVILRGIVHVVSCFPLHFMLYHGNLDYFSDSDCINTGSPHVHTNFNTVDKRVGRGKRKIVGVQSYPIKTIILKKHFLSHGEHIQSVNK